MSKLNQETLRFVTARVLALRPGEIVEFPRATINEIGTAPLDQIRANIDGNEITIFEDLRSRLVRFRRKSDRTADDAGSYLQRAADSRLT